MLISLLSKISTIFTTSILFVNTLLCIPDDDYYNNIANLIQSIYNMQIVSQKFIICPDLKNISNSYDWTNNQYNIDNNTSHYKRNLLKITQDTTGYRKFNTIINYIYSIIIPVFCFHFLLYYISNKKDIKFISSKLTGIFSFPSFEFIVIFIIINPFIQSISILYDYYLNNNYFKAKRDAIIAICLLPAPIVILAIYYVLKYIWPHNSKDNKLFYVKNLFPNVHKALITNSLGKWHPKDYEGSIGIFYEHIRGPCNKTYINIFRLFHVPIKLIKNASICFIINCYKQGLYGNRRQLILLIFLESFNIFNMINCRPLNGIRQQLCELISEITDLFVYIYTLLLLDYRAKNNNPNLQNINYQNNIISSQKAGLAVFIISQIWSGLLSLRLLFIFIYTKVKDHDANHTSSNIRTEIAEGNYDEAAGDSGGINIGTE